MTDRLVLKRRLSCRLQDEVDPAADSKDLRLEICALTIEYDVRAQAGDRLLLLTGGGGDHVRAVVSGYPDGRLSNAALCGVDEYSFTRS